MSVLVRRASGLLAPFDVPELTPDAAIDRSWEMRGALLLPRQPAYLAAYPLYLPPLPRYGIDSPWADHVYWDDARVGPASFLRGLGAVLGAGALSDLRRDPDDPYDPDDDRPFTVTDVS